MSAEDLRVEVRPMQPLTYVAVSTMEEWIAEAAIIGDGRINLEDGILIAAIFQTSLSVGVANGPAGVRITSAGLEAFSGGTTRVTFIDSSTGALTATSATITGAITASSGSITGSFSLLEVLTIGTSGRIQSGASGTLVGNGFWLEYNAGTPVFRIGTVAAGVLVKGIYWDGANLAWAGANTSLTAAGVFTATSAVITGAITATSGSFTGTVTATAGAVGGWTLAATTLTGGAVTLDSTGVITVGTGNDVAVLSSVNATYRLWIGESNPVSATFSVTKGGAVTIQTAVTGARLTLDSTGIKWYDATTQRGQILSDGSGWLGASTTLAWTTAGVVTAGGFTITATELYAGTGATRVEMQAAGGIWAGATAFADAPCSISPAGAFKATSATITGAITASSGSITGPLTMSGASSSISIGTTPPTSATVGTGIWLDRTGLYGLAANVQQFYVQASDGKAYFAGGDAFIGSSGLVFNANATQYVQWKRPADNYNASTMWCSTNGTLSSWGVIIQNPATSASLNAITIASTGFKTDGPIYPGNSGFTGQSSRYIYDNATNIVVDSVVVATHAHSGANQGGTVAVASVTGAAPLASPTFTGNITIPQARVRAYLAGNQTIEGAAETAIFGTETYDDGGDYANATGIFTAPRTREYLVTVQVRWDHAVVGKEYDVYLDKNAGTIVAFHFVVAPTTGTFMPPPLVDVVSLATTDTLRVKVGHNEGADNTLIAGTYYSWMTITEVGFV